MISPTPPEQPPETKERVIRVGSLSVITTSESDRTAKYKVVRDRAPTSHTTISEKELLANMEAAVEIGHKLLSLPAIRSDKKRRRKCRDFWLLCVTVGARLQGAESRLQSKDLARFASRIWQIRNLFEWLVLVTDPNNTHNIIDHDAAVNGRPFQVIGRVDQDEYVRLDEAIRNMIWLAFLLQTERVS